MKTDYYELLGVASTASSDELRRAYRKQALRYHPDKNIDNPEEAAATFTVIQAAYETLSDPETRAWYDNNKDAILRDADPTTSETGAGISVADLVKFMDPSLYQRFDDTPAGFFGIVRQVFIQLAAEEVQAMQDEGVPGSEDFLDDDDSLDDYDDVPASHQSSNFYLPRFGRSATPPASARAFYTAWSRFQSHKSFSWAQQYSLGRMRDRRTRRAMEKENKKFRDAARKEYNETVRAYVAFIKRRDPRLKQGDGETRSDKEKHLQMQEESRRQARRDRELHRQKLEEYVEQDWSKVDEDAYDEFSGTSEDSRRRRGAEENSERENDDGNGVNYEENDEEEEEEEAVVEYECVVCDKVFKSEAQFVSHEQSKKHKKEVARLKREMQREGIELGIDTPEDFYDAQESFEEDESDVDDVLVFADDVQGSEEGKEGEEGEEGEAELAEEAKEPEEAEENTTNGTFSDADNSADNSSSIGNDRNATDKKRKKKKSNNLPGTTESLQDLEAELEDKPLEELLASLDVSSSKDRLVVEKRERKKREKKEKSSTGRTDPSLVCVVCRQPFPSRNKLFDHVKSSGHAAPVPKVKGKNKKR